MGSQWALALLNLPSPNLSASYLRPAGQPSESGGTLGDAPYLPLAQNPS